VSRVPGFLIVVVDCLRADLLAPPRDAWPAASAFAANGAHFSDAYTTCPTTTPAFTALFTGRPPTSHGVRALRGARLSEDVPTLAEELGRAGWRTWASLTGPLLENTGLTRGFGETEYRDVPDRPVHGAWGARLLERVRENAEGSQPWLGVVHLWDLHTPRKYPRSFEHRRFGKTAYERSLAGIDPWLARLFETAGEETTVILTGDHGENVTLEPRSLRQQELARRIRDRLPVEAWAARTVARGARSDSKRLLRLAPRYFWNHNQTLFEGDVRVPIVFAGPGIAPGPRSTPVSHIDLAPTLLDLAGVPQPPSGFHGTSLAAALRDGNEPAAHPVVMETPSGAPSGVQTVSQAAIRDGSWKLITSLEDDTVADALYDLAVDPRERHNLARERPADVERLKARLRELVSDRAQADAMSAEDDAILAERLEELGYL
jgi:arylsulfatase A-like enzyme